MGQIMVLIILFNAPTMFITLVAIFQVEVGDAYMAKCFDYT